MNAQVLSMCVQMLTISSKYLVVNASGEPLQCAQHGTTAIWQLQPDCVAPFHWADNSEHYEICVRPALGSWTWSGAFKVGGLPFEHSVATRIDTLTVLRAILL